MSHELPVNLSKPDSVYEHFRGGLRCIMPGILLGMVIVSMPGCSLLNRTQTRQPHQFNLEVTRPEPQSTAGSTEIDSIAVAPFSAAIPFSGTSFQVRVSDQEWTEDYFHRFITGPDILVTQLLRNWLDDANVAEVVTLPNSTITPHLSVTGHIRELFLDLRDPDSPRCHVNIDLEITTNIGNAKSDVLLSENFESTVPLRDVSAESAIDGWELGLQDIFSKIEKSIRSIPESNP
jgi:hypothetical protein